MPTAKRTPVQGARAKPMRIGSFLMLMSFINVQLLAIVVGWLFIIAGLTVTEDPSDVGNSAVFMFSILAAAVVIYYVLKYYKGKLLFYLLELGLIFTAFTLFCGIFPFQEIAFGTDGMKFLLECGKGLFCINIPLIIGLAAVVLRVFFSSYRNIFLMFATAIVGALLGASLDVMPAALLAMGLAVYDVIAVFYTKHMVTLAKELGEREAGFSIVFPSDYKSKVVVPRGKEKKFRQFYKKVQMEAVELGTGDLAIPAMLAVSALKISFWHGMAAMLGGTIGISLLFYFIEKKKGFWPALPPIVFFALLLLLIYNYLPFRLP